MTSADRLRQIARDLESMENTNPDSRILQECADKAELADRFDGPTFPNLSRSHIRPAISFRRESWMLHFESPIYGWDCLKFPTWSAAMTFLGHLLANGRAYRGPRHE